MKNFELWFLILVPTLGLSQEQQYLFRTTSYTIKKLSQPEETYHDLPADWYMDHHHSTTFLVMSPVELPGNQLVRILSYKQGSDGKHYLVGKEMQGNKMTHEIIIDRTEKYVEIRSIRPYSGIYVKYFQK